MNLNSISIKKDFSILQVVSGILFGAAFSLIFEKTVLMTLAISLSFGLLAMLTRSVMGLILFFFISVSIVAITVYLVDVLTKSVAIPSYIFGLLVAVIMSVLLFLSNPKDWTARVINPVLELAASATSFFLAINYYLNESKLSVSSIGRFLMAAEDNDAWLQMLAPMHASRGLVLNHASISYIGSVVPSFLLSSVNLSNGIESSKIPMGSDPSLLIHFYGLILICIPVLSILLTKKTMPLTKQVVYWILATILWLESNQLLQKYASLDGMFCIALLLLAYFLYKTPINAVGTQNQLWSFCALILLVASGNCWPPLIPITAVFSTIFIVFCLYKKQYLISFFSVLLLLGSLHQFISFMNYGVNNLLAATGGTAIDSTQLVLIVFSLVSALLIVDFAQVKFKLNKYEFSTFFIIMLIAYPILIAMISQIQIGSFHTYGVLKLFFLLTTPILIATVTSLFDKMGISFVSIVMVIIVLILSPVSILQSELVYSPIIPSYNPQWLNAATQAADDYGQSRPTMCLSVGTPKVFHSYGDLDSYFCNRYSMSLQGNYWTSATDWSFVPLLRNIDSGGIKYLNSITGKKPVVLVLGTEEQLKINNAWYSTVYKKLLSMNSKFVFVNDQHTWS